MQDVAAELGLRTGSPSAAYCGKDCTGGYNSALAWFDAFFKACQGVAGGCRVDFMATHWYSCKLDGLKQYLQELHDRYCRRGVLHAGTVQGYCGGAATPGWGSPRLRGASQCGCPHQTLRASSA